ncbi:MAG: hypothetical protein LBM27_03630 [Lactobacillaceae bacterium]|jgi:hypothetical protein|nr:hypothetical protein [Lactobacillaceae bacterium]
MAENITNTEYELLLKFYDEISDFDSIKSLSAHSFIEHADDEKSFINLHPELDPRGVDDTNPLATMLLQLVQANYVELDRGKSLPAVNELSAQKNLTVDQKDFLKRNFNQQNQRFQEQITYHFSDFNDPALAEILFYRIRREGMLEVENETNRRSDAKQDQWQNEVLMLLTIAGAFFAFGQTWGSVNTTLPKSIVGIVNIGFIVLTAVFMIWLLVRLFKSERR